MLAIGATPAEKRLPGRPLKPVDTDAVKRPRGRPQKQSGDIPETNGCMSSMDTGTREQAEEEWGRMDSDGIAFANLRVDRFDLTALSVDLRHDYAEGGD